MSEHGTAEARRGKRALALLLVVAAAHFGWNAVRVTPVTGYDAGAHAGYILSIVEDGALPHPYSGWSTFHPPVYYLLSSVAWSWLEPAGPVALGAGLRAINGLGLLMAGWVAFQLVQGTGGRWTVAWVASALVLFVPVAQLATAMVGNEGLATGIGALALIPLLALQRDPRRWQAAALAGLLAGLALATKYTGLFVAVGCVVPFLRRDFDRAMLRALAVGAVAGALVAGPVYVRNVVLTGVPNPILRTQEPTRSTEDANVLRPRRVSDYLWLNPEALWRPSIHQVKGQPVDRPGEGARRNPAMTNVWGLTYASLWYDAFGHRIPRAFHRDGVFAGPLLALLGIAPTALMLFGFALALGAAWRSRGRSQDAPLVAIWLVGLGSFVAFTGWAESVVAVKGSYLLPLAVPGAVFFARGAGWLCARARRAVLALSTLAALVAALVFIHGLFFPGIAPQLMASRWRLVGQALPESHIAEAVDRLAPPGAR